MERNFLNHLENELIRRKGINASYSLRAFARDLSIEASLLSKILRRKVPLTLKMLERLAPLVAVKDEDYQLFLEQIKNLEVSNIFANVPKRVLYEDELQVLEEWYHFALVEMTTLSDFQSDPQWIAKKLGIPVDETELAIQRLLKLGFLARASNGELRATHYSGSGLRIIADDPASYQEALHNRRQQVVDKWMACLDEVPREKRVQGSISVAIDSSLLEEAREEIKIFSRQLVDRLEKKSKRKNHVYELVVSFFPLTEED